MQVTHGMTHWWTPGALACLALTACTSISQPEPEQELWDRLAAGGYVILMPHANGVTVASAQPDRAPGRCANQDHLSSRGRREVRLLTNKLGRHEVSVGRVLTSSDCRCVETAGALFDYAEPWSIIDNTRDADPATIRERSTALREAISRWISVDNLALVSHQENIREALGVDTQPAELLIIEPLGDAGFRLLGHLKPE